MSIKLMMLSNHLILYCLLLFFSSVFPSIRFFSSESALYIRWPKYWNFSFSISPSNEYSGLISFRINWFDLLVVQGTLQAPQLKSINSLTLNLLYGPSLTSITTGKTLTIWAFVGKVMSLLSIPSLEKAVATHSSTLAWKIPWVEEPGRLQSMGLQRVRHNWMTSLSLFTLMHWRRKWQPTPVFLPGESQGRGSLVGCHLWGRTESDTAEAI